MSRAYIAHDEFVKAAKAGTVPADAVLRKQFVCEKAVATDDKSSRKRTFVISTAAVDRDNDSISPKGWNLDNYKKNPVVLFAHDYNSLPIAKCVSIKMAGGQLIADCEFADHEMASTVLRLVDGGFLNATSVGFRPTKYSLNETRKGVDYEEQELLEYSIVPVPANPEALIVARELVGDVALVKSWALKTYEALSGDTLVVKGKPKPGQKPTGTPDPSAADPNADGDADADGQPDSEPDEDDKKAIANAVSAIASALKSLPELVARAIAGGCDCMAKSGHNAETCSCCKAGQCAGSCCAKAEDDAVTKAGRVLSAKNEAKVRAAHAHLDEVLKALPKADADADDIGAHAVAAVDALVIKDGDIIDIDIDELLDGGDDISEKDVVDAMTAALKGAMGDGFNVTLANIVKQETQSALSRMRGRLD